MWSDESNTEVRTERRQERRRDSAVEPTDELVHESAPRQLPYDPLPVPAAHPIPFDAEAAAVLMDARCTVFTKNVASKLRQGLHGRIQWFTSTY
jgi:hypothetical protein